MRCPDCGDDDNDGPGPCSCGKIGKVAPLGLECLRVYCTGDRTRKRLPVEAAKEWIEYNKKFRFGCALFVDGKCVQRGYLSKRRVEEIKNEIRISRG